jgi:ketosteroid isomerase-like protein
VEGVAGLAEAWQAWTDAWTDFHAEPTDIRELDATRVLVLIRRSGRGKTSGLELQHLRTDGAAVFDVLDGRVTRVVNYFDSERAFSDLGLAPGSD